MKTGRYNTLDTGLVSKGEDLPLDFDAQSENVLWKREKGGIQFELILTGSSEHGAKYEELYKPLWFFSATLSGKCLCVNELKN